MITSLAYRSLFLDWRRVAPHLGLDKTDIEEIESKKIESEKRLEMLQKWKLKYSYLATFKVLVQVLLKLRCAEHALKVCKLLHSQVHTGMVQKCSRESLYCMILHACMVKVSTLYKV